MLDRKEVVELINKWDKGDNLRGNANKAQFTKLYDIVKFKDGRDAQVELLVSVIDEIKLNSRRKEFKATLKQVVAFVDCNTIVNYDKITYDNLKRVISLSKYVTTHYEGDMTKLDKIGAIYTRDMSGWRYNNRLEEVCTTIKSELTLPKAVKVYKYEEAHKIVERMSANDRRLLLEDLLKEFQEIAA